MTAPWVAQFFEAQDVFATQADDGLYPQVHERDQNEGSRHVTRAFVVVYFTFSLLAALVLYIAVERPFLRLRERISSRAAKAAQMAATS